MAGWVKLHRCLKDKPIWKSSTPEQKTILVTLLLMANHEEKEWEWMGHKFKAKPGQFVTSLDSIVEACGKGITTQNVRTALVKFKKYEFLTDESTKTGRLITITNWELYQSTVNETNIPANKELTKSSQRANKELTPNKNDKKDKNERMNNKKIYGEYHHVRLTEKEYTKLCTDYGQPKTDQAIKFLDEYIEEKGYKSKSHNLALRRWVFDAVDKRRTPDKKEATNEHIRPPTGKQYGTVL